jgi:hypothetical protein
MNRPDSIRNEAKWIVDCTKIRARACELIENRISLFKASEQLNMLAMIVHAKGDPHLSIFKLILGEFVGIPAGEERKHWAPHALAREDMRIRNLEAIWRDRALVAAKELVQRYAWSLEERKALRRSGGSVRSRGTTLLGIATNILGSFVSRNNDVDGYWAIGKLYTSARRWRTETVTVNLAVGSMEPTGAQQEFSRMLDRYSSMLTTHLGKYRVPADSLAAAVIRLYFDSAVTDARPPTYHAGQTFRCVFELSDNAGHLFAASHLGVARLHDPLRESRSSRK